MATRDSVVYVCGDSSVLEGFSSVKTGTLRQLLLADLAVCWSTRTHCPRMDSQEQWQDTSERFSIIGRSHVFIFIYSKETISDSFYLEQYGAAKSHCVPVIGVRLTNYFMPSHLPDQYYCTEIVSCTGTKAKETLADALISDFKSAMVYARDFHKSCVERLRNKIKHLCNKKQRENHFFAAMGERTPNGESNKAPKMSVKCPKCGFFVSSVTPKLQRASSTGALLRRSDGYETDPSSAAKRTAAYRRNLFLPANLQMPSPFSTKKAPLFAKTTNGPFKQNPALEPIRRVQTNEEPAERHSDSEGNKTVPTKNSDTERLQSLRRQSRTTGTWTDKLKNKLRRQSSLPVIPTTYLVTTPEGLEKQVSFVKYPPDKPSPTSPRGSDVLPIFSEDEELEIIHISRVPSPDIPST